MKNVKFIAMALVAGLTCSCSSSDDADTSGELTGKWYYKEYKVFGETIPYDDHEACGKDYIQFNADGTGANVDIWDCVPDAAAYTYTRSGNTISVTSDGETDTAKIIELTATTLKVKRRYDFDGDENEEDVIEVYTRT